MVEKRAYLIELVVDEPVDQGWLADPAVADKDDVAVVPGLRQTVADTAHHSKQMRGRWQGAALKNAFDAKFFGWEIQYTHGPHGTRAETTLKTDRVAHSTAHSDCATSALCWFLFQRGADEGRNSPGAHYKLDSSSKYITLFFLISIYPPPLLQGKVHF